VSKRRNTEDSFVAGFDGSQGRRRGTADDTALVAIRLSDRRITVAGHWRQPDGLFEWRAPREEIKARMRELLENKHCVVFRADPAYWRDELTELEGEFRTKLWVPYLTLPSRRLQDSLWDLYDAIESGKFDAADFAESPLLERALLAARVTLDGKVSKESTGPNAPKIDLASALSYAWAAALDAQASAPRPHNGHSSLCPRDCGHVTGAKPEKASSR
jgi:hypothetical protein